MESIDQFSQQYLSLKTQIKNLEDQLEEVRSKIEDEMERSNKTKIVTSHHTIEKRPLVTERITRQSVPEELWKRYAKPCRVECLYIRSNLPSSRPRRSGGKRSSRKRSGQR